MPKTPYQDSFTVTLDKQLHERLKKYCKKYHRSKNAQIVYLLERALDEEDKKTAPKDDLQ